MLVPITPPPQSGIHPRSEGLHLDISSMVLKRTLEPLKSALMFDFWETSEVTPTQVCEPDRLANSHRDTWLTNLAGVSDWSFTS